MIAVHSEPAVPGIYLRWQGDSTTPVLVEYATFHDGLYYRTLPGEWRKCQSSTTYAPGIWWAKVEYPRETEASAPPPMGADGFPPIGWRPGVPWACGA